MTSTAGSSALTGYLEPARAASPTGPTTVPVGVTTFDGDVFPSVRALAERDHANIVSWNRRSGGSHHPAHHDPEVLADELPRFFALVADEHAPPARLTTGDHRRRVQSAEARSARSASTAT